MVNPRAVFKTSTGPPLSTAGRYLQVVGQAQKGSHEDQTIKSVPNNPC